MDYGLIGKNIKYSFSKQIHENISDIEYDIFDFKAEEFNNFMSEKKFIGINVTIPYKTKVIKHLDVIDKSVEMTNACNTVINKDSKLYGYNTDYYGLLLMIKKNKLKFNNKKCIILGNGATCSTIKTLLNNEFKNVEITVVSRTKTDDTLSYDEINEYECDYLFNTTPLGNLNYIDQSPIEFTKIKKVNYFIDLNYNPKISILAYYFINNTKTKCFNGEEMLVNQAILSNGYFLNKEYKKNIFNKAFVEFKKTTRNIVLIGMPYSGKSLVGLTVSKISDKKLYDIDKIIEERANKEIKQIFAEDGERAFRKLEAQIIKEVSIDSNAVIVPGAGAILNDNNVYNLKRNGFIVHLIRNPKEIEFDGSRPLTKNIKEYNELYKTRIKKYHEACDITIKNDRIENTIDKLVD